MKIFLLKALCCITIYTNTSFAITDSIVKFNKSSISSIDTISFEQMWNYYTSLADQPNQNYILSLADKATTVEQKMAISLYAIRWSRQELIADLDELNHWEPRSNKFDNEFHPTLLTILDHWHISSFAESNKNITKNTKLISTFRFQNPSITESQSVEISQILKLAFDFMKTCDKPLLIEGNNLNYSRVLQLLAPLIRMAAEYNSTFNHALELYIETYVVEMVQSLQSPWFLTRVYPSLLAQFTIGHMERILDIESKRSEINTIDFVQTKYFLTGVGLGMDSLGPESQQHPLGFYYTLMEGIRFTESAQTTLHNWTYHDRSYRAKITVLLKSMENNVIQWDNPVAKLREDGKLIGAVLISPNMTNYIPSLVAKYTEYLKTNGFDIGSTNGPEEISKTEFENLIVKKGLDYLVKEAHAGGDTYNIFQIAMNSQLLTARKAAHGNEPEEVFYIIYPKLNSQNNLNKLNPGISLLQFRDWMQRRSEVNKSPLIYLNSSCWSARRAPEEASYIHSPYYINIPSFDTVSIFSDKGHNHMRAFIDGIRSNLTLSEIKQKFTEQDFKPENWGKATRFLFPNDPEYDELITKYLLKFVDYQIEIFDESGKLILSR